MKLKYSIALVIMLVIFGWLHFWVIPDLIVSWKAPPPVELKVGDWYYGHLNSKQVTDDAIKLKSRHEGWAGVLEVWPLILASAIISIVFAGVTGWRLRGNDAELEANKRVNTELNTLKTNLAKTKADLAQCEDDKYIAIEACKRAMPFVEIKEKKAELAIKSADDRVASITREGEEKYNTLEKRFSNLQEDHTKRGQKIERLDKGLTAFEKENLLLKIENLKLLKENEKLLQKIENIELLQKVPPTV